MRSYEIAQLTDIEEIDENRSPFRPVRYHLGITGLESLSTYWRRA